jgi:serine/threonine-protein kinase
MPEPALATSLASHYRIDRELGAGGMATVYLARDLKHDRDVAIKVLHPQAGSPRRCAISRPRASAIH